MVADSLLVMAYLIGTDEAGYGPNLGPLVISATVWETPDDVAADGLFDHLNGVIAPAVNRVRTDAGPFVAMADSKALYSSGKGLKNLERGVFAALGLIGRRPRAWREVWQTLSPESLDEMPKIPWLNDYNSPAPVDCDSDEMDRLVEPLRAGLENCGVRLTAVRSRAIFEGEFNALVDRYGSKGAALSHQTLELAARMIADLPDEKVSVVCDKHGGRNRYAPLLGNHFPDGLIEVHGEGREKSVYRFGPPERRIEFCFRTRAESCLPAALASMASKYLRELAMTAVNNFWLSRVPGLRPTAGYPEDAKRFRVDTAEAKKRLNISDRIFWREK